MAELSLSPDYIRSLALKVRAIMAVEANDTPDVGSNPTDDATPPNELQDDAGNLTREELVEELKGLSPEEQAELVALMWLGRDDYGPDDWDLLTAEAAERREVPTENYLLDHPQLADYWMEGMSLLGLGGLDED
ncbi:DUF3775 domain-containing protein [Methyloligella sp. 2.7D]|uniref:DUF3775 domain-containing protein n=1 Tax=unclassified Methyloligella TaxID=2625955 RepID=UPI00157CF46E|nr:DUF3775 domain-containing protein [Methyloligella sp. GL2]QKP77068.1 DUF3775 domain-containing protein [Methyloligella sp. GL2]